MGRGTAAAGGGGGAATVRHSPSVSASRCHLPIASRQGGLNVRNRSNAAFQIFRAEAQRAQRGQLFTSASLREPYSKPPTRPCQLPVVCRYLIFRRRNPFPKKSGHDLPCRMTPPPPCRPDPFLRQRLPSRARDGASTSSTSKRDYRSRNRRAKAITTPLASRPYPRQIGFETKPKEQGG